MQQAVTICSFTPLDDSYHVRRGIAFGTMGCYQQAILACDQALQVNPLNAEAYSVRAAANFYLKNLFDALNDFQKAIGLDPSLAKAFCGRAAVYGALSMTELALADLNHAIVLHPDFAQALFNRAIIFGLAGKLTWAIEDLSRAIEIDSSRSHYYLSRAYFYRLLGQRQNSEDDCTSAIILSPTWAEAFVLLGVLNIECGLFECAIIALSRAIELAPSTSSAYYFRACAFVRISCKASALSDLQTATNLDSRFESALQFFKVLVSCSACNKGEVLCAPHQLELQLSYGIDFVSIEDPLRFDPENVIAPSKYE